MKNLSEEEKQILKKHKQDQENYEKFVKENPKFFDKIKAYWMQ